jgi:predicted dehydrogenase
MTALNNLKRRSFLALTAAASMRVAGANNRVRAGVIGSGGRGQFLAQRLVELGAEVAAVSDVYEPNLAAGLAKAQPGAMAHADYRHLLDDHSIDAVVIATPDHWHTRMLIDAVEAGKDVYLEKPVALRVDDGQRMAQAVRRTRRVVQVGTQRRSNSLHREAAALLAEGVAGNIRLVTSCWYNTKKALDTTPLPGKLDWERWQGPAARHPFEPARFRDWLYFRDYAGGILCEQGAHIFDMIQMCMRSSYPSAVTCTAGAPNVQGAEYSETAVLSVEYPENYLAVFTIGYQTMQYAYAVDQLTQYHGDAARFDVGRETYALYPQTGARELTATRQRRVDGSFLASSREHVSNFLDCVVSRKEPNATIEMGVQVSTVLSMGLESLRAGRRVRWDAARGRMVV